MSIIQIFTDGSKSEQEVGAGVAVFKSRDRIESKKYRLNERCANNQVDQLAILRALEYTENMQTEDKTATIHRQPNDTGLAYKEKHSHIHH